MESAFLLAPCCASGRAARRKQMRERLIDRWLNREFVIGGIRYRVVDAAFSLCLFVLAFLKIGRASCRERVYSGV